MQIVSRSRVGLVVDDNPIIARRVCDLLNDHGIASPDYATNSEETYELVEKLSPDVVIMDIRLKQEDGVDLAVRLRKDFGLRSIFLTAYGDPETRARAEAARPLAILSKPLRKRALADALDRVVILEKGFDINWGKFKERHRALVASGRHDARNAIFRIMSDMINCPAKYGVPSDDPSLRSAHDGPIAISFRVCELTRTVVITDLDCLPYEPPLHGDLPRLR